MATTVVWVRGGAMVAAVALALLLASTASGRAGERPISDAEYFSLLALPVDEEGVEVPLRNGDESLGFNKACWRHNLCSSRVIEAAVTGQGNKEPLGGVRWRYTAHVVGDGVHIVVRVVTHMGLDTRRAPTTPDARPVGVITAYCDGMLRCPDIINSL